MDAFTTVLSVFSTVCAIVFGYIAFVRNRDKDKESNVKHDATVLTEIGYIKANTDEIKAEQKEQRKTNTEFVTRLTDVEASAKQAHKRLDHIEKRMDQAHRKTNGSSRVTPAAAGASPPLLHCKGGFSNEQ
jgi:septal ring factor EnvC (AmiA/AmiB activator)